MELRNSIASLALLLTVLVSCKPATQPADNKNSADSTSAATDAATTQAQMLQNLFTPAQTNAFTDDGRTVSIEDAVKCINLYGPEMRRFGLTDSAGPVEIHLTMSRKVTLSEDFAGEGLLQWMTQTVQTLDPEGGGKNIGIRLAFGILTEEFLNKYLPNRSDLKDRKRDRIAVFLVPYSKVTKQMITTEDGTAYELGGLQP